MQKWKQDRKMLLSEIKFVYDRKNKKWIATFLINEKQGALYITIFEGKYFIYDHLPRRFCNTIKDARKEVKEIVMNIRIIIDQCNMERRLLKTFDDLKHPKG